VARRAHVDGPQILTGEISAIPDVVVSCGPIDHSTPVIAEPALIAEVMSPSSEGDDTTRKWFAYRKIPSLRHYLVLSQEQREVQVHSRAGDLWHERFVAEGALELDDPPLRLDLALCRDRRRGLTDWDSNDRPGRALLRLMY
jgi:Uma2 family endonuclease